MKKVFKLVNAELRKIFLRPTIFIMIALLLVISFLSLIIFKPQVRNSTSVIVPGDTPLQIYINFTEDTSTFKKSDYDDMVENKKNQIQSYISVDDAIAELKTAFNGGDSADVKNTYELLKSDLTNIKNGAEFDGTTINTLIDTYRGKVENLLEILRTKFATSKRYFINNVNYDKACNLAAKQADTMIHYVGKMPVSTYALILETINEQNFIANFSSCILNFQKITLTQEDVDSLLATYYTPALSQLDSILADMNDCKNEVADTLEKRTEAKNKMNKYISNYISYANMAVENMTYATELKIAEGRTDKEICSFRNYDTFNRMQYSSIIEKNTYLIDNGKYENDYLNSLYFNVSSGFETNAYDYTAFALELLAILIIVFCVVIGAKMIAGEQTSGTMKLLAIRPYTRKKILSAKLLATIFFAMIFIMFGIIVNFLIGFAFYGVEPGMMMIGVFNGSNTFVAHPALFLLFYAISLLVRITVYISIAFLISVLFRSYTGAVIISFIVYIATILMNGLLSKKYFFKFFPNSNFDLYKYFTGIKSDSLFSSFFAPPVMSDTTFVYTLIFLLSTVLIFNIISFITFKRKDIA